MIISFTGLGSESTVVFWFKSIESMVDRIVEINDRSESSNCVLIAFTNSPCTRVFRVQAGYHIGIFVDVKLKKSKFVL